MTAPAARGRKPTAAQAALRERLDAMPQAERPTCGPDTRGQGAWWLVTVAFPRSDVTRRFLTRAPTAAEADRRIRASGDLVGPQCTVAAVRVATDDDPAAVHEIPERRYW